MIRKLRSIVRVRGGSALTLTLLTVMLLSGLALALSAESSQSRRVKRWTLEQERAAYVARAGLERFCADQLVEDANWANSKVDPELKSATFAGGSYDVLLEHADANRVTVLCTGRVGDAERTLRFQLERSEPSDGSGNGIGNGNGKGNGDGGFGTGNGNGQGQGNGKGQGGDKSGGNGKGQGQGNRGENIRIVLMSDLSLTRLLDRP